MAGGVPARAHRRHGADHLRETGEAIEEERRLLYVGITRARERLYLSWSLSRTAGGRRMRKPSRFLVDLTGRAAAADRSARRRLSAPGTAAPPSPGQLPMTCLFLRLREWRKTVAKDQGVPAYVVFPMRRCRRSPRCAPAAAAKWPGCPASAQSSWTGMVPPCSNCAPSRRPGRSLTRPGHEQGPRCIIELLDLEQIEQGIFRGESPPGEKRQRVFGGQVAGQALVAAGRTVQADRPVYSLHAYFTARRPAVPLIYIVERVGTAGRSRRAGSPDPARQNDLHAVGVVPPRRDRPRSCERDA